MQALRSLLTLVIGAACVAGVAARGEETEPVQRADQVAQTETPPAPAAKKPSRPGVSRADLAAAYLRLEQAYFAHPPTGEKIAAINSGFDNATLMFFMGKNSEAIRAIDALAASLGPEQTPAEQAVVSLKASVQPPVWTVGRSVQAVCRIVSLYAWPTDEPIALALELRLIDSRGKAVFARPLSLTVGKDREIDVQVPLDISAAAVSPGVCRVELRSPAGREVTVGRVNVIDGAALDEQREANEKRLAEIGSPTPKLAQSLAACRARNQLLNDRPSEAKSVQFLADLNALARDVSSEIAILASSKDPYARRRGDYWRVVQIADREIPLRIYAPDRATKDTAVPLLVVLHGMGGDENMFLEAYGAGLIKQIADQTGILIASPLTYSFGSNVTSLNALLDVLSDDYAIDRERVYVLGHSLGAGSTAGLARGHGDTIAAACCIAGGTFSVKPGSAPILVVSPELDGVVPPSGIQASAEKAAAGGMAVEVRKMPGYGHTLAVGAILPEAVDWLLKHRRAATAP